MDQARGKPPTPTQNSTTRPVAANPPRPTGHPSDEGVFKAAPSLKRGTQLGTRHLPTFAVNSGNQNKRPQPRFHERPKRVTREVANSAAIGELGVTMFRRQMQQVGCLVLLFNLGERFHQSPGVLRRHFTILLPFNARQFSRRHQGNTRLFNLKNVVSMWPLPPSDVT